MSTAFVTVWDEVTNTAAQEYVQFSARGKKLFSECHTRVIAAACKAFGIKGFKAVGTIPVNSSSFVAYGFIGNNCVVFCAKGHW